MASFDKAFADLFEDERGYANVPTDRGGETMFGISRKYHPDWPGWKIVDDLKQKPGFPGTANANPALLSLAKDLYRHDYWHFANIPDERVASDCLDVMVNFGSGAKIIQQTLYNIGYRDIVADGALGPKTLAALVEAAGKDPDDFGCELAVVSILANVQDAMSNPQQKANLRGWIRRRVRNVLKYEEKPK